MLLEEQNQGRETNAVPFFNSIQGHSCCENTEKRQQGKIPAKRKSWLRRDAKLANSLNIKLSDKEEVLDKYIKGLVYVEQQRFYTKFGFHITRQFIRAKSAIEASPLFDLFKTMPKGGLLHLHASASGHMAYWLTLLATYNSTYIYTGTDTAENVYGYGALYFAGQTPDPRSVSLKNLVNSNHSRVH